MAVCSTKPNSYGVASCSVTATGHTCNLFIIQFCRAVNSEFYKHHYKHEVVYGQILHNCVKLKNSC